MRCADSYRHSRISSRTVLNNEDRSVRRTGWSSNVRTTTDSHQDLMEKLYCRLEQRGNGRGRDRLRCSGLAAATGSLSRAFSPFFLQLSFFDNERWTVREGYTHKLQKYILRKKSLQRKIDWILLNFFLNTFWRFFTTVLVFILLKQFYFYHHKLYILR